MIRKFLIVLVLFAASAFAQQPTQTSGQYEEQVTVGYVMVPFTVLDNKGAPVTNLKSKDTALYVDGQMVKTDMFEQ